jgi:hypothetical protein
MKLNQKKIIGESLASQTGTSLAFITAWDKDIYSALDKLLYFGLTRQIIGNIQFNDVHISKFDTKDTFESIIFQFKLAPKFLAEHIDETTVLQSLEWVYVIPNYHNNSTNSKESDLSQYFSNARISVLKKITLDLDELARFLLKNQEKLSSIEQFDDYEEHLKLNHVKPALAD